MAESAPISPSSAPEAPAKPSAEPTPMSYWVLVLHTVRDLSQGLRMYPLWSHLAWRDIKARYARSLLGPFWLTISMGIMVGSMGFLYGVLFGIELKTYFPFLCLGLIAWSMISTIISEGLSAFSDNGGLIRQINLPLSVYVYRVILRNVIVFLHNIVIYVGIKLYFEVDVGWTWLLAIPGVLLIVINGTWFTMLLGGLAARYRDLTQVVMSILQVVFFLTPVMWPPDSLRHKARFFLTDANPFAHVIALLREPLTGNVPSLLTFQVAGGLAIVGWVATVLFMARQRTRIAFWVS